MRNQKSEKGADHLLQGGYPRGMCVEDDPILAAGIAVHTQETMCQHPGWAGSASLQ